jgi:hypothetical protein
MNTVALPALVQDRARGVEGSEATGRRRQSRRRRCGLGSRRFFIVCFKLYITLNSVAGDVAWAPRTFLMPRETRLKREYEETTHLVRRRVRLRRNRMHVLTSMQQTMMPSGAQGVQQQPRCGRAESPDRVLVQTARYSDVHQ